MAQSTRKKRQNVSNNNQVQQSLDRISNLPDSVLCHILSFLPTKLAVATSILGRRWRFLWTDVPCLDFDSEGYSEESKNKTSFADIVYGVLLQHKVLCLEEFHLNCGNICTEYQIDNWVRTAIARNVQLLDLYVDFDIKLPRGILSCKTLVDLKLEYGVKIPASCNVCLPNLQKLQLVNVLYENDESFAKLLSGCSVLEDFTIERTPSDNMMRCQISSRTLKCLNLNFRRESYDDKDSNNYRLEINAPALRYLFLEDCVSSHISIGTLHSLIEANVCVWNSFDIFEDRNPLVFTRKRKSHNSSVPSFIDKLYNCKCVTLATKLFAVLQPGSVCRTPITRFHHLVKLDIPVTLALLKTFLQFAENLETLVIRKVVGDLEGWVEPEHVPVCLSSSLQIVSIHQFHQDFDVVRYILGNAKLLKMMEIYCGDSAGNQEKLKILKTISRYRRESTACELDFH